MTSHNQPSYCESCNRHPYVGRVSVGEEDSVDFIYQFVKNRFVTRNHQNLSIFCTAPEIVGPPKFSNYGQIFISPFLFEDSQLNNAPDVSTFLWENREPTIRLDDFPEWPNYGTIKTNYIDIEFHEAVYPIRVSIYEVYTPGSVIQIWVQDSKNQWLQLWDVSSHNQIHPVPSTSRLFSPPLSPCDFKTKMLRLVFKSISSPESYTKLDAVMLIGTSDLISSRNSDECLSNLIRKINCMYSSFPYHDDNLTADLKNAQLDIVHLQENFSKYCFICKSDTGTSQEVIPSYVQLGITLDRPSFGQRYLHRIVLKSHSNCAKRIKLSSDEPKELSDCTLSALPDEILLKILKYLDFMTLSRMNQVNKRFNNLTRDFKLYTSLKIRYVEVFLDDDVFSYFKHSCKYLKQLDLTRCMFDFSSFLTFLDNCGRRLTHLRLSHCHTVDNFVIRKISEICKNLKELDLTYSPLIDDEGFSYLEELNGLKNLNLSDTVIQTQRLCKILQKNRRMRELHLAPLWGKVIIDLDVVAVELGKACPDLEAINLKNTSYFRLQGINVLTNCKNLRKVTIESDDGVEEFEECLSRSLSSCQCLEEVYLRNIVLHIDRILELLIQCKNLKRLYLNCNYPLYASHKYSVIMEHCPKLQEFYLIHCEISDCLVNQWKERYPHVSVYTLAEKFLIISLLYE